MKKDSYYKDTDLIEMVYYYDTGDFFLGEGRTVYNMYKPEILEVVLSDFLRRCNRENTKAVEIRRIFMNTLSGRLESNPIDEPLMLYKKDEGTKINE